jgi:hypothetical protein
MDPGRYLGMVLRTGLEWSCGLMHRCLRMGESDAPAASCDFASMLVPILVFNRLDPCRLPCRNGVREDHTEDHQWD